MEELNIYGSSRLGTYNGKTENGKRTLGNKQYELANHLGNVLAVISDNKLGKDTDNDFIADYYEPLVISESDYYPYGMMMDNRSYQNQSYAFGFNGQMKSFELDAEGDLYTAEFWQYDSRSARRWNVDPITVPRESGYAVFRNNPIGYQDANGDCPTCISGAIVSGLLDMAFQVGEHMLNGDDFETAFSKVDWGDVAISATGGFITGAFSGGFDKLIKYAGDSKKRKILVKLLDVGFDALVGLVEEYAKDIDNPQAQNKGWGDRIKGTLLNMLGMQAGKTVAKKLGKGTSNSSQGKLDPEFVDKYGDDLADLAEIRMSNTDILARINIVKKAINNSKNKISKLNKEIEILELKNPYRTDKERLDRIAELKDEVNKHKDIIESGGSQVEDINNVIKERNRLESPSLMDKIKNLFN